MFSLLLYYFSLNSILVRLRNKKISLTCFFDKYCVLSTKSLVQRFTVLRNTTLGDYTYVGYNSTMNNVTIGKFCSISKNVNIGLGTHPINFVSTSPIFFSLRNGTGYSWVDKTYFVDTPARVIIGNDVWIGMNVTIMGGINVGDGSIIGSHALVTKDVPPYAIVGGVPAKIIKYRFPPEIIEKMIRSEWWNLSDQELKTKLNHFNREVTEDVLYKLIANEDQ